MKGAISAPFGYKFTFPRKILMLIGAGNVICDSNPLGVYINFGKSSINYTLTVTGKNYGFRGMHVSWLISAYCNTLCSCVEAHLKLFIL